MTAAIRKHIAQRKARRNKRTSGKQLIVDPDRFVIVLKFTTMSRQQRKIYL